MCGAEFACEVETRFYSVDADDYFSASCFGGLCLVS